jgi:CheY-like chemotaxis protein/two-component sensor histidine kinase
VRKIVRDLKTFTRGDEEKHGPVDIRRVIESSLHMAAPEMKHRARVERDYGKAPPVMGSESRLGQVFLNLLVNAAQAIPEGRVESNVITVVTSCDLENRVVVEIRDTGIGIPGEIRGRLLEPFFTTKPVGVGTGLGLAIVHSIVQNHGGELEIDSEVGKGTVVRVRLPAAEVVSTIEPEVAKEPASGTRGKFLVIDDEMMVAKSLQRTLSGNHDVEIETYSKDALARFERGERFDLVFCDLMMPEVTGMELYELVQRLDPAQAAKIVFVSGGAYTERGRTFLDSVPNRRLEKPLDPSALEAVVREVIG